MRPLTREWVEKAEGDWEVAEREWQGPNPVYDVVCFLSQQCAEKYLKAVIQEAGMTPSRTHDLVVLLNQIETPGPPAIAKEKLARLSGYAVDIRYPGERAMREDAEEAIQVASEVRLMAKRILGLEDENDPS
jgi:HEPN domain-containing protein